MIILGLVLWSCKKDKPQPIALPNPYKSEAKTTYADIAFASYNDSYTTALALQTAINAFVANPTAQGLEDCKTAWKAAREPYGQTEVFRFTDGPIDNTPGYEGYINSWPLDESFIDYVQGNATSGIINDTVHFPTIDEATLINQNQNGSETNIATGYHAIEFLLWGQDLTAPSANLPGQRPYTDYLTTGGTASNQARRGTYLKVCAQLLVDMLKATADQWDSSISGNYRASFLQTSDDAFLQKIFSQPAILSNNELGGERLYVAYQSKNQEDEHSCFSDNTHRDIILNAKGIQNLIEGSYTKVDGSVVSGKSLYDVINFDYSSDASSLKTMIDQSVANATSIPSPFDEAISVSAPEIITTVTGLQQQAEKLVSIAKAYGITVTL